MEMNEFEVYRRKSAVAAKQLGYGNDVANDILNAKSYNEITRILKTARMKYFDDFDKRAGGIGDK